MSPSERRRREDQQLYGKRYVRKYGAPRLCTYCASPADTFDHCPPLCAAYLWESQPAHLRPEHILVSCCADCNKRLGSRQLFSLEERATYLLGILSKQYERGANLWSAEELAELSSEFRKAIKAKQALLTILHTRIRALQLRELTGFADLS